MPEAYSTRLRDNAFAPEARRSKGLAATLNDAESSNTVRWMRVVLTALAFFMLFFVVEHEPANFAGMQVGDNTEDNIKDEFIDRIEDGTKTRQFALIGYGFAGLAALVLCRDRPWNLHWAGALLFLLLVGWAGLSLAWSVDPSLTFRRLAVLGMILSGTLGAARLLRANELLAVTLLTFVAFVLTSLLMDVGAGGRPWESDYRFAGTLHPNIQAAYCGVLCLAAFAQPVGFGRRWLVRAVLAFGLVMLVQTQSRTSAMAVLVGLLLVFMVRLSPAIRWWSVSAMVALAAAATMLSSSLSEGGRRSLTQIVLLGRTEQAGSLTGRVPLWQELSNYAADRPITGFGYEAFWTADRIDEIMKSQEWALQSAHNGYFDVVLQLGWIGLGLTIAVLVVGFNLLQTAYARTGAAGYAFGYGMLGFAMVNSLLESHFVKLKFPTVVALMMLLSVLAFLPREAAPEDNSLPEDTVDPRAGLPQPAMPR